MTSGIKRFRPHARIAPGLYALIRLMAVLLLFSPSASVAAGADASEMLVVAQRAFDDGFYDVAQRYIVQLLEEYPSFEKTVQAKLLLGQCFFFQNQYVKAYDIFHELLPYAEVKDATLFWLGETYYKGANLAKAREYYRKVIAEHPDSAYLPQAVYSLAWTYYEEGDYVRARKEFERLTKDFPAHELVEDALFKTGECAFHMKDYAAGEQTFRDYLIKYPHSTRNADAFFYSAECQYHAGDYLDAVTNYAKAANAAATRHLKFMSQVSLGWSYLHLDKFDLSEKAFLEALDLADGQQNSADDIYLGLASLYTRREDYPKALEAYKDLIEKYPESPRLPEARLGKANIAYIQKDYPSAVAEYQQTIDLAKETKGAGTILEKAQYGLAWTYLRSGESDKAIRIFQKIMDTTDSPIVKVSAFTQIADAYFDTEQYEQAIATYDRILDEYRDSITADYVQFRLGLALLKLDRIDAATLAFQSLQTNFPDSKYLPEVNYYLGVAYFKKNDWSNAVRYIKDFFKDDSSKKMFFSEAGFILGQSYFFLEQYDKALATFEKLIRSLPDQKAITRIAELNIAKCKYHKGLIDEAIKEYKVIHYKYPDSQAAQEALILLGDHYLENNEWDLAIHYYKQFLTKFPGSPKAGIVHYELGQAYQITGQFDLALNHYRAIPQEPDKDIYGKANLAIADIFSQKLDPESAIEKYLLIAKGAPDFQRDAYHKIALIYQDHHEYRKAIASFEKALLAKQGSSLVPAAQIQFEIGDSYEILNQSDDAVESYLKIPYLYPEETALTVKAYLRVARVFEDQGQWDHANTIYQKISAFKTDEAKYARERMEWIKDNVPGSKPK